MRIGTGAHTYDWSEKWAKIPDTQSAREGWAHHGIVVSNTGNVISFHQADPTVLIFDGDGSLVDSWEATVQNAHGMTLVEEGGEEFLWLADNLSAQVVKTTLDGQAVMSIDRPDLEVYREGKYSPTDVTVYEERNGGNGDIIVTDGYGSSYIHHYDKDGNYLRSINGAEGDGGHFATPHGVWIDTRKPDAELYIADRSNGLLCKNADAKLLASRILTALEDKALRDRLTETARGQAYEVFGIRAFVDNYQQLYANVLDGRKAGQDVSDTAMVA